MARHGWIYLRVVDGKGYCIGKTEDIGRRDAEYTKENPFVETLCAFEVQDIDKVERVLINRTSHLRLLPNSKEWLQHTEEVVAIVELVRRRFALMTYIEWRQLVRERREKRMQPEKADQECNPPAQPEKADQECNPPAQPPRPVRSCPQCGSADAVEWKGDLMLCKRCWHIMR
jgi:hypothetical protein